MQCNAMQRSAMQCNAEQKLLTIKLCHACQVDWAPLVHLLASTACLTLYKRFLQDKPEQPATEAPALRMQQHLRQDEQRWST